MVRTRGRGHWDELKRRGPSRDPKPRLLVVCEGKVTEPCYFNALKIKVRVLLEVVVVEGPGVPKTLVERAKKLKKEAEREATQKRDDNLRYEEVWCVLDIDEHPRVADARQQARDNGIELAISNPCFELWALLHFQDQTAALDRHSAQKLLKKHLSAYDKELPFEKLDVNYTAAQKRAMALDKRQERAGQSGANPSTAVYKLTRRIRGS